MWLEDKKGLTWLQVSILTKQSEPFYLPDNNISWCLVDTFNSHILNNVTQLPSYTNIALTLQHVLGILKQTKITQTD